MQEKENMPKKEKPKKVDKEVLKLQEENLLLKEKCLRLNAEMQNLQKRYSEELQKISKRDGEQFIRDLLPVIDNFERAFLMDDDNPDDEVSRFLKGFQMIYDNLLVSLHNKGVKEIDALDKAFDPNTMEAVITEKDASKASGTVLAVLQKGYLYNDILLRPAMVKVNE